MLLIDAQLKEVVITFQIKIIHNRLKSRKLPISCCDYLSNKDHTQREDFTDLAHHGCDYLSNKDHTQQGDPISLNNSRCDYLSNKDHTQLCILET